MKDRFRNFDILGLKDIHLADRQEEYQKRGSILPIAAFINIECIITIISQKGTIHNYKVVGESSAPNMEKYYKKAYVGALQNAMYKAVNMLGKTGKAIWVDEILDKEIGYPNSDNIKIKRVNINGKYYNKIWFDNKLYSKTKWTPKKPIDFEELDLSLRSFDTELVSEKTKQKWEEEGKILDEDDI